MKRARLLLTIFIPFILVILCVPSCGPIVEQFDETDIIGRWRSGMLYEVYSGDHTGYTWDESDDVTEAEAQEFEWEITSGTLTQIHIMEMGGRVPKTYTLVRLNDGELVYKDAFGQQFSFVRVN